MQFTMVLKSSATLQAASRKVKAVAAAVASSPLSWMAFIWAVLTFARSGGQSAAKFRALLQSSAVLDAGKTLAVVSVIYTMQWIKSTVSYFQWQVGEVSSRLWEIETTNQVLATRSNVCEWRQCLQSIAQWHQVPLQSAYAIWQSGSSSLPACPANQWSVLPGGQPLSCIDQWKADAVVDVAFKTVAFIDSQLSTVWESKLLVDSGNATVEEGYQTEFDAMVGRYHEWKELVSAFEGFRNPSVSGPESMLFTFHASVDWNSPVFKKNIIKTVRRSRSASRGR